MINESCCAKFLDLCFDSWEFGGVYGTLFLTNGGYIRPCVDVVFYNGRVKARNFGIGLGKDITEFFEECFVLVNLLLSERFS